MGISRSRENTTAMMMTSVSSDRSKRLKEYRSMIVSRPLSEKCVCGSSAPAAGSLQPSPRGERRFVSGQPRFAYLEAAARSASHSTSRASNISWLMAVV